MMAIKRLFKWFRRVFMRRVPEYSETYSEPGVVFVGEVIQKFPPDDGPQGLSETFSEPGVVFEIDCRAGKEHTGTAGN